MNKEEICKFKTQRLVEEESTYSFPAFLRMLRRNHGITRRQFCDEIGIGNHRMFYLESGRFRKPLTTDEVRILSEYYSIDTTLIYSKMHEFISSGQAVGQKRSRREWKSKPFNPGEEVCESK